MRRSSILNTWSDSENEELTLTVSALTSEGSGLARTDKGIVFVNGALPGETVRASVAVRKKDFSIADTLSIENPSSGRTTPRCKYYGHCGGCQLQHADYSTQLKLKAGIVIDAMRRLGGFNIEEGSLTCEASPDAWNYRNKAAFPVQNLRGKVCAGFYRAGTHRLELIRQCPVNAKRLNQIYGKILDGLSVGRLPFDGYDERSGSGKLRHLIMRTGIHTGESLLSFVVNGKLSAKSVKSLVSIGSSAQPDTITMNHNSKPGNVILGTYTENLTGFGIISEMLGKYRLAFDTASFFQINTGQAEKLFTYAASQTMNARDVLELYSGTGSMTCYLAENSRSVTSVEEWRGAVRMAGRNLQANGFSNVEALCGRSEEVIEDLQAGRSYDCVVLDPPRDGCNRTVLEAVNRLGVRRIVYVSCNPATLARDCRVMSGHGYTLESLKAFDMFPQTAHVESVAVLVK